MQEKHQNFKTNKEKMKIAFGKSKKNKKITKKAI